MLNRYRHRIGVSGSGDKIFTATLYDRTVRFMLWQEHGLMNCLMNGSSLAVGFPGISAWRQ
jgi:hypothetical protein